LNENLDLFVFYGRRIIDGDRWDWHQLPARSFNLSLKVRLGSAGQEEGLQVGGFVKQKFQDKGSAGQEERIQEKGSAGQEAGLQERRRGCIAMG
jgi:hypothetical protein